MTIFPWKRFWCHPTGQVRLDPGGYLIDPEGEYGRYTNPDVVAFEEIESYPCLVLLGEPGIGKTFALLRERQRLEEILGDRGDCLCWVDLKDYGTEERLWREVFECRQWDDWKRGTNRFILFFDSLDEGLIRVSNLSRVIAKGIRTGIRDRLFLRIACRTADWPPTFHESLKEFFAESNVRPYEMVHLREKDVLEAARIVGIDPDKFIADVNNKGVGPLAAKPVTLRFLLSSYQRDGVLAHSQTDLYEKGCLYLCEEPDEERREAKNRDYRLAGVLSPDQRLALASRIATGTTLGNRSAVYVGSEIDGVPEDDVAVAALAGGSERTKQGPFNVDEHTVRETLRTGLFNARGEYRLGWAHQTYTEFLTARYLRDAPLQQVKSLFSQSDGIVEYIIPQLREATAWLAGCRPDVFAWVVSVEPEVLLRSDISGVDHNFRERLVAVLLKRFVEDDLLDSGDLRTNYHKLSHPKLSNQLEHVIKNRTIGVVPRRAAIDIAEACAERSLQDLFVDMALDRSETHYVRVQAAHAVWKIADEEIKKRLAPLARGEAGDDPDDDLRGIGLRCMWPRYLSATELLAYLMPPQNVHYFGQYEYFLRGELSQGICDGDLPTFLGVALDWHTTSSDLSPFKKVAEDIVKRAWKAMETPGVRSGLAKLFAARIRRHEPVAQGEWGAEFKRELIQHDGTRKALLGAILNETDIRADECVELVFTQVPIAIEQDALWLLSEVEHVSRDRQAVWARCIVYVTRGTNSGTIVNRILEMRPRVPALATEFEWLNAWDLDSDRARNAKADYLRTLRRKRRGTPRVLDPSPAERIDRDLELFDSGNLHGWINLTLDLTLEPTSTRRSLDFSTHLPDTPGWRTANQEIRDRIVSCAKSYVLKHAPTDNTWFGSNQIPWVIDAGYRAFRLLIDDCDFIETIPVRVWEKWAPTLVSYPGQGHHWHARLACLAYRKAAITVLECLGVMLGNENEVHGDIFCLREFQACWDEQLGAFVLERLKQGGLKPRSLFSLGDELLSHRVQEVETYFADMIRIPVSVETDGRGLAVTSVSLLLIHASDSHWPRIWSIFEHEPDLAEDVLKTIAQRRDTGSVRFIETLHERHLRDLYLWMSRRFPPEADADRLGARLRGPREMLADLRDALLRQLVNRGTKEACKVIEYLVRELPDQHPWLIWRLREAQTNTRRQTWASPTVPEIICLLEHSDRRYVESESQLLAVVNESLDRLQSRLQEELPAVIDLWNYEGGGTGRRNFRPKDEEDLSDYIARWLRDDLGPARGIIVNREVQPRRGQKTDIYVSAFTPGLDHDAVGTLTVVIEVKGCWNQELGTAMKGQLVDRYMADNALQQGLFIVGWYLCDAWSDEDGRKGRVPNVSVIAIRERLGLQADDLSRHEPSINVSAYVLDLTIH